MIFVDTNLVMYAVGRPHPLQDPARESLSAAYASGTPLYTSAEVLQELVHAYLGVGRKSDFDAAIALLEYFDVTVWDLTDKDMLLAADLYAAHPNLSARDLCHLAVCIRHNIDRIMTFDQGLADASTLLTNR